MSAGKAVRWLCGIVVAIPMIVPGVSAADLTAARTLTFAEATELLVANSRDIRLARFAVESAAAAQLSARARPNPSVSAGATAIDPANPGAGSLWNKPLDAVVQLSQLIERGDKRTLRDQGTGLLVEAARGDLADTVRVQVRALALNYFDLLRAQEQVRIADDTLGLFARTVSAARLRLKAGDIAPSDLARLNVDALRAENDRRQAEAERDRLRADLALRLGLELVTTPLVAVDAWPSADDVAFPADLDAVISQRADVRAATRRVEAADRFRSLAQSLRTRDVTIAAQVERYPGQSHVNTVGFGVTVPLFVNYHYDGEIRRSEVDRDAARENLARVRAAALTEIRQAWTDLAAAKDRVRRYDQALLGEATRAADAAEFAYRNGALGVIDLLDARRILVATQVDAITARADLGKAIAAWRAALTAGEGGS